ncbi:MAG TPA: hypothetical protein PKE27_17930 [Povalibacter sp.]|uniref:hypothetical protein n=1 Tax=Povalibacter sp. TaxID=1962978 RepID=UPI002BF76292|nr:hypothetical protein [Povalibacter sp.]HMN46460.1 hypothetical protein [Povalibacter sp.]
MEPTCEVIGWLLDEGAGGQVLIRENNGDISSQAASPDSAFGHFAVQTGAFRRGNPIIDPRTMETVGYEMERISAVADRLLL